MKKKTILQFLELPEPKKISYGTELRLNSDYFHYSCFCFLFSRRNYKHVEIYVHNIAIKLSINLLHSHSNIVQ